MAVPSYTTDLQLFKDFESAVTLSEFTNYIAGRGQALSTDYPIQGSQHVDTVMNATGQASCSVDYGSNITWTTGWAMFSWVVWTAPGAIATQANGGLVFILGAGLGDYRGWYVGGSDFGSYPYGGWQNFAVDPQVTASETLGTPGTSYRYAGAGVDVTPTAVAKGSPLGLDVIRFGRGEFRVVNGSSTDGYATFAGMATTNDNNTNRWGLFQYNAGIYKFKGFMILGYGAATEFTDSNKYIVIDNTQFVQSTFNRIEIRNASSVINWTNIAFTALGTVSKGDIVVIDNATFNLDSCTFTDMNSFTFQSNTGIDNTTFRRCGLVTQGGAAIDSCQFRNATGTVALLASAPALVTNTEFVSSGTGHAIQINGSASVDYTLTGLTFTGYSGTSTNAAIYVNIASPYIVNLTISNGDTPSIRTAGATVNVLNDITTTFTGLKDNTEIRVYPASTHPASFTINNISGTAADLQSAAAGDMPVLVAGDELMLSGCGTSTNNIKWTVSTVVTSEQEYRCTISSGTPTAEAAATGVYVNPITELKGIDNAVDGSAGNRSYSFALPASTEVEYVIYNITYQPIYARYTVPSANVSIAIQQQADRWYYDEPE